MKIGVFFSDTNPSIGGGFQYEINIAKLLNRNSSDNYKFVFFTNNKKTQNYCKKYNLVVNYIGISFLNKIIFFLGRNAYIRKYFYNIFKPFIFEEKIKKFDVDILYFISPNMDSAYIEENNYIFTIWDQCHRDNPEFIEVKKNLEFEKRENLIRNVVNKSVGIIVESEISKKKLAKRYGADLNRIYSVPCQPSSFIDKYKNISSDEIDGIKKKLKINKPFIFYPAQLWSHKNHIFILKALNILINEKKIDLDFYFCGKNKGNLENIISFSKKYSLEKNIKYLDFVDDKTMVALYKSSIALVMPTYFGAENMPPLDAFKLSCPVCYTLFDKDNELLKNSIWPIDLLEPNSLVNSITDILKNENLKNEKILNGQVYLKENNEDKSWKKIKQIFDNYKVIKDTWKI